MTDANIESGSARSGPLYKGTAKSRKRYSAERRFRLYGLIAVIFALTALVVLIGSIVSRGYSAFTQTYLTLEVTLDPGEFGARPPNRTTLDRATLLGANYGGIVKKAIRAQFPEVTSRRDKRSLTALLSPGAADQLRDLVVADPSLVGKTVSVDVPMSDDADMLRKGFIDRTVQASSRRLDDKQIDWYDRLYKAGKIESKFNIPFFTTGDSREPELAGIWGAVVGSFLTLIVTLVLAFPLGVSTAIYLEEFAPKNRWTDLIEVNINNLAAVPSIVFGLLGLAVFLNVAGLPRSAPLVGGMVLALMTLPTVIIAGRAAIQAVPPSIREAALGVGASKMQTVMNHVLPLAMPGILTGTIIGMARALGETAPLLMIGMVAFIVDIPGGFNDPATVLPVQIYLWADSPERAFLEKTSAATMVLLAFLVIMNALAVLLRKKFERRW